jgi:hypothetical protein
MNGPHHRSAWTKWQVISSMNGEHQIIELDLYRVRDHTSHQQMITKGNAK